jgi:hypothetical protein
MRPKTLLLGLNAALLLSTSVMAADAIAPIEPIVIEDEEPMFSLSIDGGVRVFGLPDTDTIGVINDGLLDVPLEAVDETTLFDGLDEVLLGGGLRVQASAPLNADGAAVNFSAFGAWATRSESDSRTLQDETYLAIRGPSLPAGTIDLDTIDLDIQATGTNITDWGDATSVVTPVDTANSVGVPGAATAPIGGPYYQVNAGADGFSYAGAAADYQTYAFGVLATKDGVIFLGAGELAGTEIWTDVTQNLTYAGGDITFSQSTVPDGSGVTFTGYVGPSFRYLGTETTTDVTVQMNQHYEAPNNFQFPTFDMSTVENIDTYYGGAVIGGNVDVELWTGATLSLGLGGGAYYASTSYESETDASISGGNLYGTPTDGASVQSNFDLDAEEGFAYTIQADSTFSADIGENLQLNFGIGAEYMSRVATARFVGEDGATGTANGPGNDDADADYNSANATGGTVLSFGDAWSYKATIGLTGQF